MARLFYIRAAAALALCSLGFLLVSLDPFLSAAPVGQGVSGPAPSLTVNHFRKGNRLPVRPSGANWPSNPRGPAGLQTQQKVPLGCDPAFSPVTSPALSGVYGRCMT
jgi:hypothetical protein